MCIEVHCLRCCNMTKTGFEKFANDKLVMDLPKRRPFRCTHCDGTRVETRPRYPYRSERREFLGLKKRKDV